MSRRTRELASSTRGEIALSIGAALFFAAVVALRFAFAHDRIQQPGWIVGIALAAWVLISLYRFRDRIWRGAGTRAGALTAPCRDYYRTELEARRDHLRNEWLWQGPLLLACAIAAAIFMGTAFPGLDRVRNAMPLVVLLAAWAGFDVRRRRRRANEIQREIDEIDRL